VLIEHVLHATLSTKVDDQDEMFRENLDLFLDVWTNTDGNDVPRQAAIDDASFTRNVRHARAAAAWLQRLDDERQGSAATIAKLRSQVPGARASAAPPTPPTTAARIRRRLARLPRDRG
jgi:hypothetical protein